MAHETTIHPDALELAELLRPAWAQISDQLRASGVPLCEGDDGGGDGDGDDAGGGDDGDQDGAGADGADDGDGGGEPDWKAMARKHERRAKQDRKAREELERQLKEREDADKSDQDKALEKAREEAKAEAKAEAEAERRNDRLEVAVARHAAKTFADVDDALLHVQRDITNGEIDPDDIFDEQGKVQTEPLQKALEDLLERKPHLKAGPGRPAGDGDGGKGSGDKSDEDMTTDEHLKAVQRR